MHIIRQEGVVVFMYTEDCVLEMCAGERYENWNVLML